MQDFITFWFFVISCILLIILILKKNKVNVINKEIENQNNELKKNKELLETEIKLLKQQKEQQQCEISQLSMTITNAEENSCKAFEQYCDTLTHQYYTIEKEYDEAIYDLKEAYDKIQDKLIAETDQTKKDLDKISSTRAAALEAQLKEQEIKNKQSFYCPQISEADLKDAKTLRDIEYKLNNPRILRMLIWSTFYQKPMNQVCANVLGTATVEKCGIYKITNQKTDLMYIGQAVDIATRWKNHAKAGLGIDTPANNKLYKAMMEDGLESFSFEVLEECNRQELNEKEHFYINLYQSDKYGYNLNNGINK